MAASNREFNRWVGRGNNTWPFQVFQKHNAEMSIMETAHASALKYVYNNLGKQKAKWEDPVSNFFPNHKEMDMAGFSDVRCWSNAYGKADNWFNLNLIMAISSNMETYLSTAIKLSLESDVGVLYGASRKIDGVEILKHGKSQPFDFEDQIISCTKGDWGRRCNAFIKIFGEAPGIITNNIKKLERIRKIRNDVAHAFGRDIKSSRSHEVVSITTPINLDREKVVKSQKLVFAICKAIDKQLFSKHIGEYQAIYFYHKLRNSLKHDDENKVRQLGNQAAVLKKKLGRYGAEYAGKKFCKGLIEYYEAL